jgi:predicted RNase H-like HicB family nuclease
MMEHPYSLIIEATREPDYFGFYSPDLVGFTGIGHSVEDCLFQAKWGMKEHVALLKAQGLPIPKPNPHPQIVVKNAVRPAWRGNGRKRLTTRCPLSAARAT